LGKKFVGNAEIELAKDPRPIEEIIPNLEKLKRLDLDNLNMRTLWIYFLALFTLPVG